MSKNDYLFSTTDWFSLREAQNSRIRKEIAEMSPNTILSTPIDDICDELKERFWITVPTLDKDGSHVTQKETEIDVSHERGRHFMTPGPHVRKGTEVTLTIPFLGEADAFKIRPSSYSSMPPMGEIRGQILILKVIGEKLDAQTVKAALDLSLGKIEGSLSNLRSDCVPYNDGIIATARPQLEARKAKLLSDQNLVAELGFPLRPRTNQPSTYTPPSLRRILRPSLSSKTNALTFRPEPALLNDDYEHILKVLDGMAMVMERSPSAFKDIDEEALRTHFLVQLNGHYEGQATGETFNFEGKTDILVRVDGRNVFIGECKYWSGPKKLLETVDQILGYSSWRDTKVAMIIFNRNKNFTAVIESIRSTIPEHPNFKRFLKIDGESRSRFVLAHKDDPSREMIVTVIAFDVPTGLP